MKIWRNKRVVKDTKYTYCANCCLEYGSPDDPEYICLARRLNILGDHETCNHGYKYENMVE